MSGFSLSKSKKENEDLHDVWRKQRAKRQGYAEPSHPFQYQGSADINTYKMFTELGHALLREGGNFSFITPSGIYSDKGTGNLRDLFLNKCQWTHLYAFQNERFVFTNIDHRNKMVVFTVTKGGHTTNILTRFRLGPGDSPEAYELESNILNTEYYLPVSATEITKFSPNTKALLEIRTKRDLEILEKIYANSVLLGDDSPTGWGIKYSREFDMTNDSKLFPPRPQWEAKGYRPDEYGHWLKGNWQFYEGNSSVLKRPQGLILSADGNRAININDVDDVALPLYQGIMIGQMEVNRARWISGSGNQAVWEKNLRPGSPYEPQFLISKESVLSNYPNALRMRYLMRNIARTTDSRTMIGSPAPGFAAGHSLAALSVEISSFLQVVGLGSFLSSFVFDWCVRQRLAGTNLSWVFLEELPIPPRSKLLENLVEMAMRLSGVGLIFSKQWQILKSSHQNFKKNGWKSLWAITPYESLRIRTILDAVTAEIYGLELEEFICILQDCDYPTQKLSDNNFTRTLEPKAFWRVDKEKDPELRHTVLSLIAFHKLKEIGLEAFLNLNDGEGWMLPETLRLVDYRLGRDERARQAQPVASRLGERFLAWQLEGTPEESWKECELHAENLTRLLGAVIKTEEIVVQNKLEDSTELKNPIQLNLFGNT